MNKLSFVCASALTAFALSAVAQPQTPPREGPGWGPGMMGGYGPGMMGNYGPGRGGYGAGAGGYGPGMMGGGMMGGYGHGYGRGGMMGLGPLQALDLSNEQLSKINQIQDETRRRNWGVMGKLIDEQSHMRDLFLADKRDPAAIGKQAMKIADLRRQMLEASVDAHNRVEALLNKEQKEQLRNSYRRGWMMGDD